MAGFRTKANLKIVSGDNVFQDAIRKELIKALFGKINTITNNLRPSISSVVSVQLMSSQTVTELLGGQLRDDFGLKPAEVTSAIGGIIDALAENFQIKVLAGSNQYVARLSAEILPADFSLSSLSAGGSYQSTGGNVDWLEWLLTRGTEIIIGDYSLFEHARGRTRSGGRTVMVPLKNLSSSEPFRVDPSHAGTEASNFVTRALEPAFPQIVEMVAKEIKKVLE